MIAIKKSHVGRLHSALNIPQGKPIPAADLMKALHSKSGAVRKMATFAQAAGKWHRN